MAENSHNKNVSNTIEDFKKEIDRIIQEVESITYFDVGHYSSDQFIGTDLRSLRL